MGIGDKSILSVGTDLKATTLETVSYTHLTAKEPGAQGSQQRRRKPATGGKNSTKTQK